MGDAVGILLSIMDGDMVADEVFCGTAVVTVILGAAVVCCFSVSVGAVEIMISDVDNDGVAVTV